MEQQLLQKLPQWYCDISPDDYYLILTNDMDSYYSCRILQKCANINIGGFYSFDGGLYLNMDYATGREPIYVDLSIAKGKAFDNHYTFIRNPESVNPNVIKRPYFKKYNGGTLPFVSVLFDDYHNYTEYQWTTILAVDSFYYGYYNKEGAFRDINVYWFNLLGITDYVVPILERKTADDFAKFIEKDGLNEQIYINDTGYLVCKKNIELPPGHFELVQPIEKRFMPKWEAVVLYEKRKDDIVVSSETYSDEYVLNLKKPLAMEQNQNGLSASIA